MVFWWKTNKKIMISVVSLLQWCPVVGKLLVFHNIPFKEPFGKVFFLLIWKADYSSDHNVPSIIKCEITNIQGMWYIMSLVVWAVKMMPLSPLFLCSSVTGSSLASILRHPLKVKLLHTLLLKTVCDPTVSLWSARRKKEGWWCSRWFRTLSLVTSHLIINSSKNAQRLFIHQHHPPNSKSVRDVVGDILPGASLRPL